MNYGRFFEFDFESSKLDEGIAVFNYRWLQDSQKNCNTDRQTPRYPIYLTFTSEAIVFNLHYRDEWSDEKDDKTSVHYHNPIIELYLSPNMEIADGLTESLNEAYLSEFPVRGNTHLRALIRDAYKNDKDEFEDDYSSLEIYAADSEVNYDEKAENVSHFLRKIVLDFLFDFEFTGVFKNLAFYNEVSIKLKENLLFNALLNKYRYYYFRMRLIGTEMNDSIEEENDDSNKDDELHFLFQRYELAEREWMSSIMNPKSMKAFHVSPWFNECHEELEQVFLVKKMRRPRKQRDGIIEKGKLKDNIVVANGVSDVQVPQYYEDNPKKRLLKKNGISEKDTFGLTVSNLLNVIHKRQSRVSKDKERNNLDPFGRAVDSHYETTRSAVKWEVEHFRFWGVFRVWCGDRKTMFISLLALLSIVAILVIINARINNDGEMLLNSGWKFIVIAGVGTALLYLLKAVLSKFRRDTWGQGIPSLLMPRLMAAIVAAWFTMSMSEDLFLKLSVPYNYSALAIIFLLTIVFIIYESHTLNPYDGIMHHVSSALVTFIVAYVYAFTTGILVYDFFGENFISVYSGELYMQGEDLVRQGLDIIENGNSEIQGNLLLSQGNALLVKSQNIMKLRYVFVTQFSFFATFIGLFLQLMLQGNSITKSE